MFNDFLTTTLQVVIALNLGGLITYFYLGSRRRPTPTPAFGHFATAAAAPAPSLSLWNKLTQPYHKAMGRSRELATSAPAAARACASETLDASLGRLRRVLNGYGESLR
ncbi:MAG: hypothetical protein HN712_02590 [Gemmatimonadetes bacterium]|jgi:hypothetical protein|nr:hypothetical protein [Gemmatimonadota bacterium]MBT7859164.1 hypothetical protein [Gemmatimonadota bacterium]